MSVALTGAALGHAHLRSAHVLRLIQCGCINDGGRIIAMQGGHPDVAVYAQSGKQTSPAPKRLRLSRDSA